MRVFMGRRNELAPTSLESSITNCYPAQHRGPLRLGACPKIDCSTADKADWPGFPVIFVKQTRYSPQMIEKPDSIGLALATTAFVGRAPSRCLGSKASGKTRFPKVVGVLTRRQSEVHKVVLCKSRGNPGIEPIRNEDRMADSYRDPGIRLVVLRVGNVPEL